MKQQVVRIKEEAGRCLLCHEPMRLVLMVLMSVVLSGP